jgi:hypothetical protein
MGLGQYGKALDADPFTDDFSQKVLGKAMEGIRGMRERDEQSMLDTALSAGISRDSPAFMRMGERMTRRTALAEQGTRRDVALQQAMEALANDRLQAQMETQLRGISRQAQGMERAASTGASASMSNARLAALSSAAGALGGGGVLRGFAQPFDVAHLNTGGTGTQTAPQQGWGQRIGNAAASGLGGYATGMGMGGGKGGGALPPDLQDPHSYGMV